MGVGFYWVVVVVRKSEKQKSGSRPFSIFRASGGDAFTAKGADLIRVLPPGTSKRLPN
jgi:hypothetical protein